MMCRKFWNVAMVALTGWGIAGEVMADPALRFATPMIERKVKADDIATTAKFEFTNTTDRAVRIRKVDLSCTCTTSKIEGNKWTYAPGEKGSIEVTMQLGTFSGQVDKTLTVYTDEGDPVLLTLRCQIPDLIRFTPRTLKWKVGEDCTPKKLKVTMYGARPIKLLEVGITNRDFDFETKTLRPGGEYEVTVTPKSTASPSFAMLTFKTDSPIKRYETTQAFLNISKKGAANESKEP